MRLARRDPASRSRREQQSGLIRLLLRAGADAEIANEDRLLPLDIAVQNDSLGATDALLAH